VVVRHGFMGSNLVGHKVGFIFANSSLEWS